MIVRFAFANWLLGMGTQNTFVLIGVISLVSMVMPAFLVVYGKRARIHTAHKYVEFAAHQQAQRPDHQQRCRTQQIS
jgi:hypothetical protein